MNFSFSVAQETWTKLNSGVDINLRSVHFTTQYTGYAVGSKGCILKTTNGGKTWNAQYLDCYPELYCVDFIDLDTGYVSSGDLNSKAYLYKTTNQGKSWFKHFTKDSAIFKKFKLLSLYEDWIKREIWIVGKDSKNPSTVWMSKDFGHTWKERGRSWVINGFDIRSNDFYFGWFIGHYGRMFLSLAWMDGDGCEDQSAPSLANLNEVQAFKYFGFAVGMDGTFIKNTNIHDWFETKTNFTDNLYDLHFLDNKIGWVCGGNDQNTANIYKTTDGGESWVNQLKTNSTPKFNKMHFLNKDLAYAVGELGTIYKYTSDPPNSISIGSLTNGKFCQGETINVPFILNGDFEDDNIFKLQLSDEKGMFDSPVEIGSLKQKSNGEIFGIFPDSIRYNEQIYKLRIVSTNPQVISTESNIKIGVYKYPEKSKFSGGGTFCTGDLNATIRITNIQKNHIYLIQSDGIDYGTILFKETNEVDIPIKKSGIIKIIIKNPNNPNCYTMLSDSAVFKFIPIPDTPKISQDTIGRRLVSSAENGNQWYLNGLILHDSSRTDIFPSKSGYYSVTTTLDSCPSLKSSEYYFTFTSLNDSPNLKLNFSPNPVTDYIDINVGSAYQYNVINRGGSTTIDIQISNIYGELIDYTYLIEEHNSIRIITSDLPKGIYFVKIGEYFAKFVKI